MSVGPLLEKRLSLVSIDTAEDPTPSMMDTEGEDTLTLGQSSFELHTPTRVSPFYTGPLHVSWNTLRFFDIPSPENHPWTLTENERTAPVLNHFDQQLAQWRQEPTGRLSREEYIARHINDWIQSPSGLNMRCVLNSPERTVQQIFETSTNRRIGNCTEFTATLLALFDRAGIPAEPVWVRIDRNHEPVFHFCVRAQVGRRRITFDPVYRQINPHHELKHVVSRNTFEAWTHYNRAKAYHDEGHLHHALREYNQALRLQPGNVAFRMSRLGVYELLAQSQNLTPRERESFSNLHERENVALIRLSRITSEAALEIASFYLDRNEREEAIPYLAQARQLTPSHSLLYALERFANGSPI